VLTDGANEPEISFYQLYNVERVEVLKGPGGFLYGANPIAGTINMVRGRTRSDNGGVTFESEAVGAIVIRDAAGEPVAHRRRTVTEHSPIASERARP